MKSSPLSMSLSYTQMPHVGQDVYRAPTRPPGPAQDAPPTAFKTPNLDLDFDMGSPVMSFKPNFIRANPAASMQGNTRHLAVFPTGQHSVTQPNDQRSTCLGKPRMPQIRRYHRSVSSNVCIRAGKRPAPAAAEGATTAVTQAAGAGEGPPGMLMSFTSTLLHAFQGRK
jgi:hypothetical protein